MANAFTSSETLELEASVKLADAIRGIGLQPAMPTGESIGNTQPGVRTYGILAAMPVNDPLTRRVYGATTNELIGIAEVVTPYHVSIVGFGSDNKAVLQMLGLATMEAFTVDVTLDYDANRAPRHVDVLASD